MKKIILPNQTYFITTNIRHWRWIFAKRENMRMDVKRRGWGSPPTRLMVTKTRTHGSPSAVVVQGYETPAFKSVLPIDYTCAIAMRNLSYYRKKFLFHLHGFVLMSNHVHLLLTVSEKATISEIMRDWKSRIAFEVNRLDGKNVRGPLWQRDFWEHSIRNDRDFAEKLNYIHQNPVKAGYVQTAEEWKYSSARWYADMPSCIELDT